MVQGAGGSFDGCSNLIDTHTHTLSQPVVYKGWTILLTIIADSRMQTNCAMAKTVLYALCLSVLIVAINSAATHNRK